MTSQARRDMVLKWHANGLSATETARLLKIPVDEVRAIIIQGAGEPKPDMKPEFIEPPMFK